MSDEQPPRQLGDVLLPEPLGHIVRLIERLGEQISTSDVETHKKFAFILEQQAQLTASVGQLTATVGKLSDKVDRTAGSITNLLAVAEIQAGEIKDLTESVRAVDERQRHTDERLNVLINTVERFISEGKHGA